MYAMQLLQWGVGMARYLRGLAQPAVDILGAHPSILSPDAEDG